MDPTAALANILTMLVTGDDDREAAGALRDLAQWIDRDGFLPDVTEACEAAGIVTR